MFLTDDDRLSQPLWIDEPDALDVLNQKRRANEISEPEADIIHFFIDNGYAIFDVGDAEDAIANIYSSVPLLWKLQPADLAVAGPVRGGRPYPLSILGRELARGPGVRILDMHSHVPGALSLYLNAQAHRLCSLIFGAQAVATQSLFFEYGSTQSLHRDPWYVNHAPRSHLLAIWFALEDVHPDSGSLSYVPGSHKLPYYRFSTDDIVFHDPRVRPEERDAAISDMQRAICNMPVEHIEAKRGQALIWHGSLVHGGSPVRDPARTRQSLVVHYGRVDTHPRRGCVINTDSGATTIYTEKRYLSPEGATGFFNPIAGLSSSEL